MPLNRPQKEDFGITPDAVDQDYNNAKLVVMSLATNTLAVFVAIMMFGPKGTLVAAIAWLAGGALIFDRNRDPAKAGWLLFPAFLWLIPFYTIILLIRYWRFHRALNAWMAWYRRTQHDFWLSLSGREFECALAELFRSSGFRVELTPASRDGGADIILSRDGRRGSRGLSLRLYGRRHSLRGRQAASVAGHQRNHRNADEPASMMN